MCRLVAYSGEPCALESVITLPPHSLIEQSHAATEAKLSVNGDGFGFAWYNENQLPGLYREVMPAWTDGNLLSLARTIRSGLFMAHVRASTFGQVSRSNCHPFTQAEWSFAHNGQISNFAKVKRRLEGLLPDELYAVRHGNTDSELIFLLLIHYGVAEDPLNAMRQLLKAIKTINDNERDNAYRMACIMSNGHTLYAWRISSDQRSPSLYYKQQQVQTGIRQTPNIIIASEPIDDDTDQWQPVAENCLLTVDSNELALMSVTPDR